MHENNEECIGEIQTRIKGGFTVFLDGIVAFLPGSQVDLKPLKTNEINNLMKKPQRFLIVKMDAVRGNVVVSRREILNRIKNASKEEKLKTFKVGDIVEGVVKNLVDYGCFLDVNGFDMLCHLMEISYSRINHPSELLEMNQKVRARIIKIDEVTSRVSVSIKSLSPDPFETTNYKVGDIVKKAEIKRIVDFGVMVELENQLEGLVHSSHCSWKKNITPKKLFSLSQLIDVKILEIDNVKRRISLSIKECTPNPIKEFAKKYPIKSKIEGVISSISNFGLFAKAKDYDVELFCHYKQLSYSETEKDLNNYKNGNSIFLQVLEINLEKQQVRCGKKQLLPDEFDYFKDLSKNQIITVNIVEILDKGIMVSPDKLSLKFLIRKSEIALSKSDQRPNRYNKGDRIDVAISNLEFAKRKVAFSIRLLEKIKNDEAIKRYGVNALSSGRSLPFFDLPKVLKKKGTKKEE